MTSYHARSTEHLSYLREGRRGRGEAGFSHRKQRHKVEEKAAEVRPDLGEIWSLLQEQWGPCTFCGFTLLQPGSPLLSLTHAQHTFTSGPWHLLSLIPEILPQNSHDLLLAFTQKVTSPRRPRQTHPTQTSPSSLPPSPFPLHSLARLCFSSGPFPFPHIICVLSASQTRTYTPRG